MNKHAEALAKLTPATDDKQRKLIALLPEALKAVQECSAATGLDMKAAGNALIVAGFESFIEARKAKV